ncbi:MAG TPA: hypothetical protein VII06_36715 [Chloroflexota bacterium]|jgi:hypothetical protein
MDEPTTVELDAAGFPLPLQDALRAIGYGLEASQVRRAHLLLDRAGITVETTGAYAVRTYSWDDLAVQVRVQQGLRHSANITADPWTLTRWSVLLRATGLLLDRQSIRAAAIDAAVAPPTSPRDCQLTVRMGERVVLTAEALHEQLEWLRLHHVAEQPPLPAAHAAWWSRFRHH